MITRFQTSSFLTEHLKYAMNVYGTIVEILPLQLQSDDTLMPTGYRLLRVFTAKRKDD